LPDYRNLPAPSLTVVLYDTEKGSIDAYDDVVAIREQAVNLSGNPAYAGEAILLLGVVNAIIGEAYDAASCFSKWLNEERSVSKLHFSLSEDKDFSFLSLILPVEKGFTPPEKKLFFNDLLKHPGLPVDMVPPISVILAIDLIKDGRLDEAAEMLNASRRLQSSYLIDGALDVIERRKAGMELPLSLNFFIGKENAYFKDKFCSRPFTDFEITPNGDVYICCPMHLPKIVGNVHESSYSELLNSNQAKKIRRSILDGTFKYCDPTKCRIILGAGLQEKNEIDDLYLRSIIDAGTSEINHVENLRLSYDPTCNLSCPSCRRGKIVAKGKTADFVERVTEDTVLPLLAKARTLMMNGYGDIFTSRACRKILQSLNRLDHPNLKLDLLTNGVLFTREEWEKFPNIHGMVNQVRVSVDAVTETTYNILRRGGNFAKLRDNLKFLSELRRQRGINTFDVAFVIQKENLDEIIAFAEWGVEMKCDNIHFEVLMDWRTYGHDGYLERAVHLPENPHYGKYLEIIRHPIFKNDFIRMNKKMVSA
jgi:MoaA/NifB/PqqE/SkfB family radical SAM enzyme